MGFGRTIVGAVFSIIVLFIVATLLNSWLGDNLVFDFFKSIISAMGKMMETITKAFQTGSIPDVGHLM